MEEKVKFKNVLKETVNIAVKFFKRCKSKEEILELPKRLRRSGNRVELMNLGMSMIGIIFSFMLTLSNQKIEQKMIFLGIALFMLYRSQKVAEEAYHLFQSADKEKRQLIVNDEISLRGSQIIALTLNKVLKKRDNGIYSVMEKEEILNCAKRYLGNLWEGNVVHKFQVMELISTMLMLVAAIKTNTAIPQKYFIPLLIVFGFIAFFSSAYLSYVGKIFRKKNKEYDNKQSIVLNDVLRVPEIIPGRDVQMRISIFQKTVADSNENVVKYTKQRNGSNVVVSALEVLSQYGIIILYILGVEWNSIDLGTIAQITANLVIVETALKYISRIFRTLNSYAEVVNGMEQDQEDIDNILKVYYAEKNRIENAKKITDIEMPSFEVSYQETSENDKPFRLISEKPIKIKDGEVAVLYGPSGSGKSTFMKMITQRITLNKSDEIPATSRFLFYDETLKLGSLSIYEELFCCDTNPNLTKMQFIMKNLHLWDEISSNCHDVWQWMKEKRFDNSLSNGQKQRLILAKMLYWLDDNIDVLVLDEATSGLDDHDESEIGSADASGILKFIVDFANSSRKRTIVIATHQNINEFIDKMTAKGYKFTKLFFKKSGNRNIVTQN